MAAVKPIALLGLWVVSEASDLAMVTGARIYGSRSRSSMLKSSKF